MKNFDEYEMNGDSEYDIPIEETFAYEGLHLRVVHDNYEYSCKECFFNEKSSCWDFACFAEERLDGKDVVFKEEIEQVKE